MQTEYGSKPASAQTRAEAFHFINEGFTEPLVRHSEPGSGIDFLRGFIQISNKLPVNQPLFYAINVNVSAAEIPAEFLHRVVVGPAGMIPAAAAAASIQAF